jgi:hypothetical protein
MGKQIDLACAVCTEDFLVPIGMYRSKAHIVVCPCCGSTDVVPLGMQVTTGDGVDDAAA